MLLDHLSIDALKEIITGDSELTPYLSGPKLISWFNPYGFEDEYAGGLPEHLSRNAYALMRVKEINEDDGKMKAFLESIVDSRRFANEANLDIDKAADKVNSIIANDQLKLVKVAGVYRLYNSDGSGEAAVTAVFEEIQAKILEEIESAQFMIWVAVAWFTDQTLYDALVAKRKAGVDVKVILNDDDINRGSGLNFDNGFRTKWIPPNGHFNNIMHHKFCVIDLRKVLHGSYNWTNKARFNQESISVTEDRAFSEKFAKTFVTLAAEY